MITERIQQNPTLSTTKYYQFATILEHVIDCFHTIVSDETNPYYPPLAWLTRKPVRPPDDELFLDLIEQCSAPKQLQQPISDGTNNNHPSDDIINNDEIYGNIFREPSPVSKSNVHKLSLSVSSRLIKCSPELRKDIVSRKKDGCTPLFLACKQGHIEIVKYLLDTCNADIEQKGLYETLEDHHVHSVSPLWVAAVSGNIEVVKLLIERKANVNSVSDTGSTTLRSICFLCKDDDNKSEDISLDDEDDYSRNYPVQQDVYMDIVRLLVESGADLMKPNYNGGTCLINSIHNYELTRFILDHGADVDATDYQFKTALHYAIQQGRFEVTKLLLSHSANKDLRANLTDDALQLACLGGHVRIFEHLINRFSYSKERLIDSFRLLGSSILELHFDLARVRRLWKIAVEIQNYYIIRGNNASSCFEDRVMTIPDDNGEYVTVRYLTHPEEKQRPNSTHLQSGKVESETEVKENNTDIIGDRRSDSDKWRSKAYSDMEEFSSLDELDSMTADDFRIQSLLISERVLGLYHRETIQRLLYRGTFYINSLQPERCINLWIYALRLRLEHDSIFHFEPIFAAQAITRLFLDLLSQQRQIHDHHLEQRVRQDQNQRLRFNFMVYGRHNEHPNQLQQQQHAVPFDERDSIVKFSDVYGVLQMLVKELEKCKRHLNLKPTSVLHEDIFDLLLAIIVNLLFVLKCVARIQELRYKPVATTGCGVERSQLMKELVEKLIKINPRTTSTGAPLLHLILAPSILDGDMHRLLSSISDNISQSGGSSASPTQVAAQQASSEQPVLNSSSPPTLLAGNNQNQGVNNGDVFERAEVRSSSRGSISHLARMVLELVDMLLESGFEIDSEDGCGHSAMQVLCLTNLRSNQDKSSILRYLVDCGAHVDRHTAKPEQRELIWQSLREAGINPTAYVTLACLAASKVAEYSSSFKFETSSVPPKMRELIAMH